MSEKRFRANFDVSIYDSETEEYISVSERGLEEIAKRMNEQQATISALKEENDILKQKLRKNYIANKQYEEMKRLQEENEQLKYELQKTKEYLQTKIDECKNYKKMKEIVFGVEQAVGYEKALLQFQKGLKRRLNNE